MSFALTATGLSTDTYEEIVTRLREAFVARFGVSINTEADAFIGECINIMAEFYQQAEGVALDVYSSFGLNGATGTPLDERASLTGSIRRGATSSTVSGILTFNAAGTVSDGDQIRDTGTNELWQAINGPYTVAAAGTLAAQFQAVNTGPVRAPAGSTWTSVTLPAAVDSFTNPTDDADLGRDQETDAQFRRRIAIERYAAGDGFPAAIRAVVSRVDGVTAVRVYWNPATSPVDADGIPFKAFNVVVETDPSPPSAALQQLIGNAIATVMGPSGQAYGTDYTFNYTDSEGQILSGAFDLVDVVQVYANITISTAGTETEVSPLLSSVVATEVLAYALANYREIGRDQIAGEWEGVIWGLQNSGQIQGMTDVTVELSLTGTGGPYADPLVIGKRERPAFDSAAIVVTFT